MKKSFFWSIVGVVSFVLPAVAGVTGDKWELYGSARMSGWYWDRGYKYEKDTATGKRVDTLVPHLQRMIWDLEHMSRFGAYCKEDRYAFRFEAGWGPVLREMQITKTGEEYTVASKFKDGLILRRLYGEWFLDDHFSLLLGQEWCLANFFLSSQTFDMESGLCYSGALYTSRKPQVRFTAKTDIGDVFNIQGDMSIVKPDTFIVATSDDVWNVEASEKHPKLEAGLMLEYSQDIGIPLGLKSTTVAGLNRYDLVANRTFANPDLLRKDIVIANLLGELVDVTVWKCRVSYTLSMGMNLACYGVFMGDPWGWRGQPDIDIFYPKWGRTGDSEKEGLQNTFTTQQAAVFNIKPFDWLALEVGGGKIVTEHDENGTKEAIAGVMNANIRQAAYVNLQFHLLDGHMLFIPEWSISDLGGSLGQGGGIWNAYGFLLQFDM
ncbi:MAG: hypothetical protein JXA71_16505 [Chitinispirillaceae bacterium]|nr:hypothetical protein [Chitinispirillaceae bacterium]